MRIRSSNGFYGINLCPKEITMRITIKLDAFDHASEAAFAVLWLDRELGRWSREAHDRLDLPPWGVWSCADGGLLLLDPETSQPVLMLRGLTLGTPANIANASAVCEPAETQNGCAEYFECGANREAHAPESGHWHIQCIDRETTVAEHEVFSDEPDAVSARYAHPGDAGSFAT
jgi:hypothetical protein